MHCTVHNVHPCELWGQQHDISTCQKKLIHTKKTLLDKILNQAWVFDDCKLNSVILCWRSAEVFKWKKSKWFPIH